jgi:Conserved TM helix
MENVLAQIGQSVGIYIPKAVGAVILLVVAWVVAGLVKAAVQRIASTTQLDQKLGSPSLGKTLADLTYWLVFLVFLPGVFDALSLQGLLAPLQTLLNQILGFFPNLIAAALIFVIGTAFARIIRQVITSLLAKVGTDQLSERAGLAPMMGEQKLSGLLGLVAYTLIFVVVLISSLDALKIASISGPATTMLNQMMAAIPGIFVATITVGVAYVIGTILSGLVTNLLTGIGFNKVLVWLGFGKEPAPGQKTPSEIAGFLVLGSLLLFASIEALKLLTFTTLAAMVMQLTVFAGQVFAGLVIFALGLYLANVAARAIQQSQVTQADLLATAARIAVLVLSSSIALRQIGLASDIINLAFGLMLGAFSVAVALAFGLGGREVAGRLLDEWVRSAKIPPSHTQNGNTVTIQPVTVQPTYHN